MNGSHPIHLYIAWGVFAILRYPPPCALIALFFNLPHNYKHQQLQMSQTTTADNIILSYADLQAGKDLCSQIQKGFGPKANGILYVEGIPGYAELRRETLLLISKLAHLPQEKLKRYQRPEICHSKGWSKGKEVFRGKEDTSKASFYMNCCSDQPYVPPAGREHEFDPAELKFFSRNVWVEDIPQIEIKIKALSQIMIHVGSLLAKQIDAYAHSRVETYPVDKLHRIIKEGNMHIGRMLYYLPFENKGEAEDDWCGWHNDHGSLTALTSAMYVDENDEEIKFCPKEGGLYAKNRFDQKKRIAIPADMLAFQLGESTQIHTGGSLMPTPHCVVRSPELAGRKIARTTFALFMQSDPLEVMAVPEGVDPQKVWENEASQVPTIVERWENRMPFKGFHQKTLTTYAKQKQEQQ